MRCVLSPAVLTATLVALHAPAAHAQQCLANVPHVDGTWTTLPYAMPINPIMTTLIHTGEVLIVAGSENDANNQSSSGGTYRAALWDPTGTTANSISVQTLEYDVFCSGAANLPDGRTMVVGGTSDYAWTGENRATIFDPATSSFTQAQSMVDGRWYATTTALGDGRILAWSGLSSSNETNASVEIYDLRSAGAGWSAPIGGAPKPPLYPRLFLLPDGKVFWTGHGAQGADAQEPHSWIFDPDQQTWAASAATTGDRDSGSAVLLPLLPPDYRPRVMSLGGGQPGKRTTEIIDLSDGSPSWAAGPSMSTGRVQMNAVLLPDGKVLAEGGSNIYEVPDGSGKRADLYDPSSNSFASGGVAAFSRLYHSTALLLPDATVASVGSNPGGRGSYQPAIEIYTPAYLYDANDALITSKRASITGLSSSGAVGYGATVKVSYTSASPISSAVLIRPGSPTHASDMEQRLVGLCGAWPEPSCAGTGGTLSVTMPPNGNVAPPGWYMLFLLDSAGVPSHARFVHLSPYAGSPPVGSIAAPAASVTTIDAGDTVSFSAATHAASYSWVFPGGNPATSTAQSPGAVQFSDPGEYVVSFTPIDGTGNSDPSPDTRTVRVMPSSPNFYIGVDPPAKTIMPGAPAKFTVTIYGVTGFSGSVSLDVSSESGFPAGVTNGGFSPSTITGSGTSTLTMNTTASTTPYALSLTVSGTSGAIQRAASTTLLVALPAPTSLQATPGNKQASLTWSAVPAATDYRVKRAAKAGGPYQSIGCQASTSFTDTNLANGATYYYVVNARYSGGPDEGGESADSAEKSVTPQAAWAPGTSMLPTTPTSPWLPGLPTTPTTPWLPGLPTAPTTPTTPWLPGLPTTPTTPTTPWLPGLPTTPTTPTMPGTTTMAPPAAPSSLAAMGGGSTGSISLAWAQSTSAGLMANRIYRRTADGAYPSTPTVSLFPRTGYENKGLTSNDTYCYVITAVSASGESAKSNESCAAAR